MSYIVAMRKNEIGIRMALGASRGNVIGIVVRQTLTLLAVGVGAGLVLSLAAAKGANSLLYGLTANDPLALFSARVFWLWLPWRPATFPRTALHAWIR